MEDIENKNDDIMNINSEKYQGNNIEENNKSNGKEDTEISISINEETNVNSNNKEKNIHKKNLSTLPSKINHELIEKNILNENQKNIYRKRSYC